MQMKHAALFSVVASAIVPYMIYARTPMVDMSFGFNLVMHRLGYVSTWGGLLILMGIGAAAAGLTTAGHDHPVPRMTPTWMLACALVLSAFFGSELPLGLLGDYTEVVLVGRAIGRDVVMLYVFNIAFFAGAISWALLSAWTIRRENALSENRQSGM